MSMPDFEASCLAFTSFKAEERRSLNSSAKAASDGPRVTDVLFIAACLPEGDGLAVRVHDYAFRYALDRAFEVFSVTKLFFFVRIAYERHLHQPARHIAAYEDGEKSPPTSVARRAVCRLKPPCERFLHRGGEAYGF